MSRDVGQPLLNNAKRGSLELRLKSSALKSVVFKVHLHVGLGRVMAKVPVQGRQQAKMIERSRAKVQ